MSSSFNYTGRELISPQHALIRVSVPDIVKRDETQVIRFKVVARLKENYSFPNDAPLIVEAYNYLYYKRFEYGTVGDPRPEPGTDPQLDVDGWEALHFRVKVIDPQHSGRILGEADQLRPILVKPGNGDGGANKRSLLSISSEDIGQRVWMLRFDPTGPVVVVNKANPELRRRIEDPLYRWLVFPEILQRVLERIVCIDGVEFEGTQPIAEGWRGRWLSFATILFEPPPAPSEDPKEDRSHWAEWVDDVVRRFCEQNNAWEVFSKSLVEEAGQ